MVTQAEINSKRYGRPERWAKKSFHVKTLTGFRCCYPGCDVVDLRLARVFNRSLYQHLKGECDAGRLEDGAIETHHASYLGEQPGEHLFPLCAIHHGKGKKGAHHPMNWYKGDKKDRVWISHQKPHYHALLVRGWQDKVKWYKALILPDR